MKLSIHVLYVHVCLFIQTHDYAHDYTPMSSRAQVYTETHTQNTHTIIYTYTYVHIQISVPSEEDQGLNIILSCVHFSCHKHSSNSQL